MKILAVVPARAGSKRITGKNIRPLAGKPLITWTIEVAAGLPEISAVLVSTDAETIASVARTAGALVPWLRPAELATDTASSIDVCLHAVDAYENAHGVVDGVLLLAPTSPFRTPETMKRGLKLFAANPHAAVIAISPAPAHPMWCFTVTGERMRPYLDEHGLHQRSQDLPPAYVVNGAFYLISPTVLRERRTFFIDDMVPLLIDAVEGLDLDTEMDWQLAEAITARRDLR